MDYCEGSASSGTLEGSGYLAKRVSYPLGANAIYPCPVDTWHPPYEHRAFTPTIGPVFWWPATELRWAVTVELWRDAASRKSESVFMRPCPLEDRGSVPRAPRVNCFDQADESLDLKLHVVQVSRVRYRASSSYSILPTTS